MIGKFRFYFYFTLNQNLSRFLQIHNVRTNSFVLHQVIASNQMKEGTTYSPIVIFVDKMSQYEIRFIKTDNNVNSHTRSH